jgi:hypothetical protein
MSCLVKRKILDDADTNELEDAKEKETWHSLIALKEKKQTNKKTTKQVSKYATTTILAFPILTSVCRQSREKQPN